jgi:hypothetical protein
MLRTRTIRAHGKRHFITVTQVRVMLALRAAQVAIGDSRDA